MQTTINFAEINEDAWAVYLLNKSLTGRTRRKIASTIFRAQYREPSILQLLFQHTQSILLNLLRPLLLLKPSLKKMDVLHEGVNVQHDISDEFDTKNIKTPFNHD